MHPHIHLHNQSHPFTPIRQFRAVYNLPSTFGVPLFEHKDYTGLGSIERAGADLQGVRQTVLAAIPSLFPSHTALAEVLARIPSLTHVFQEALETINANVGLKDVEIDFAVGGFADVCNEYAFARLRAHLERREPPTFEQVYQTWLDGTVRVLPTVHPYAYGDEVWQVQVIVHAYGRAGLVVQTSDATQSIHYVHDAALGCPAEGYMLTLLAEVCSLLSASAAQT